MHTILLGVHMSACLLLILAVLLQAGRGAGLPVFGGGSDTMFASPTGSSFLKQTTVFLAGTFAVTSLMLTLLATRVGMRSVTNQPINLPAPASQEQPAPSQAAPPPQPPAAPAAQPSPAPAAPQGQ